jgi:hypothetical protein
MRNCLKTIISISAVVSVLGLNSSVFGVAAFARQTGLDCTSCHSSAGFPTLNTFGAAFKAGGYVNGDDANMMGDGEALSIPKTLNISVVAKVRYNMNLTNADGTNNGANEADVPDELALLMGGRVGKNVGYLLEWVDGALTARVPLVYDIGPAKLGVVIFATDAMGPQTVFEVAATGAQRNLRVWENQQGVTRPMDQTVNDGVATGLGAYIYHSMFYAAYTPFVNSASIAGEGMDQKPAHYIRAAVTPNVAGLDLLVGGQVWTGTTGVTDGDTTTAITTHDYSRFVVDGQVQGTLGVPLLAWFQYGSIGASDSWGVANGDISATRISVGLDAQIIENKANIGGGFETKSTDATGDKAENYLFVGAKYNLLRNLRVNLEYKMGLSAYDAATGQGDEGSMARAMVFGSW